MRHDRRGVRVVHAPDPVRRSDVEVVGQRIADQAVAHLRERGDPVAMSVAPVSGAEKLAYAWAGGTPERITPVRASTARAAAAHAAVRNRSPPLRVTPLSWLSTPLEGARHRSEQGALG